MIRSVSFIGAGNVAHHLAVNFKKSGILIDEICSKNNQSAKELAAITNSKAVAIDKLSKTSDLYIISIKDDEIHHVVNQLQLIDKIVVHTSGTMELNILKETSNNIGVIYPLQTFSKNKTLTIELVPFCIEANNNATQTKLTHLISLLSNNVNQINSEQRKKIHLAAVFACNFTNHFYHIAQNLLAESKLDFNLLLPLINETSAKVNVMSPKDAQTGPAIRHDQKTIAEHINALKDLPDYQNLYKFVTQSIQKSHE